MLLQLPDNNLGNFLILYILFKLNMLNLFIFKKNGISYSHHSIC